MKRFVWTLLCVAAAFSPVRAQVTRCGTDFVKSSIRQQHPERIQSVPAAPLPGWQQTARTTEEEVVIPVVFHVILTQYQYNRIGGAAGLERRVLTQVDALNRDFNAQNADSTRIPAVFKSRFGNARIRFGLARQKPQGNGYVSTFGYELKLMTGRDTVFNLLGGSAGSTYFCSDAKYESDKGLAAWDPTRYLNIWVVRITEAGEEGTVGIATPPSMIAEYQIPVRETGVVITYGVLGSRSNRNEYFFAPELDQGRTLVHELGHFFELEHVWGPTYGCGADDGIADTPPQDDANFGCPSYPQANCTNTSGGEMFMNYMDYVNDGCMYLFTQGQVSRMRAQIAAGGRTYSLTRNPELTQWPSSVAGTGIGEAELILSPNPARGLVTLQAGRSSENLKRVSVVDMTGREVKSVSLQGVPHQALSIDVSGLNRGIYLVLCHFEAETISRKLILQ